MTHHLIRVRAPACTLPRPRGRRWPRQRALRWRWLLAAVTAAALLTAVGTSQAATLASMRGVSASTGKVTDPGTGSPNRLLYSALTTSGGWSGWNYLSAPGNKAKKVVLERQGDGRLEAVMIGLDDQVWHNQQTVSGGWTGWNYLSASGNKAKKV